MNQSCDMQHIFAVNAAEHAEHVPILSSLYTIGYKSIEQIFGSTSKGINAIPLTLSDEPPHFVHVSSSL